MNRNDYDGDTTTFSPQGRIHQVEYAMEAVKQGSTAVACVGGKEGWAVVAAIKRAPSDLGSYQKKLFRIDAHCGIAISGLTSDARVLSNFLRNKGMQSRVMFKREIPIYRLVASLSDKIQAKTQGYGSRPYGIGMLMVGHDDSGPHLWEVSPSGVSLSYVAMAIGSRAQSAKTYFEKTFESYGEASLDDMVHHALRALRDTLPNDKTITNESVSVGIVGPGRSFEVLEGDDIKDWVATVVAERPPVAAVNANDDMQVDA